MAEFTDYLENRILDHVFRNTASIGVANPHTALYSTTCTDAARGTEIPAANGYARQPTAFSAAAAGAISNSADELFTASGANWPTVVAVGIEDALTTGNQLCFDNDFNDTPVNDQDTLKFAAGDIDITLT